MKQVLQDLGSGSTVLADVPAPGVPARGLQIATRCSLISAGTERMLVEFGRAGWLDKMRQQPAKVRQVLDKVRTDGLLPTIEAVRSKLDQPLPLGYCNVGVVCGVGTDVRGFRVGDRVVSNGPHAEVIAVGRNLCVRIPDEVSDEAAAFTVVGAIGLQGMRLAGPELGEFVAVIGLGLIGLITVQLLRAQGCHVLGIDPDPNRAELARRFGAQTVELGSGVDPVSAAYEFSRGRGVDVVLITAATASDEPMAQAARMCRKRGRIVLVGVAGLKLERADFYEKELNFQVSCSYGPGRYDPSYEEQGVDYPFGLVRWTEQRNFEAILDLMAMGALDVAPLISHRFDLQDVSRAYDLLVSNEPHLGILLRYGQTAEQPWQSRSVTTAQAPSSGGKPGEVAVGCIGAGNYAGRVLIPALARTGAALVGIASAGGVSAAHLGRKHGFLEATTDAAALVRDPRINTVVVATRHDSHAQWVIAALSAGKHVFVEKPLAISASELAEIESVWKQLPEVSRPLLMVGFNRRFAPHIVRIKKLLAPLETPKTFVVTINAGFIPAGHWTQDIALGGGRLVGECCHFIDLLRFLAGAPICAWQVATIGGGAGVRDDKATITLKFADGSLGSIHYFANGHSSFPKERIEVFCAGRILQLDNFRKLRGYGWRGFRSMGAWKQDKGQQACASAFVAAVRDGLPSPIPIDELFEVSRRTIEIAEAARK